MKFTKSALVLAACALLTFPLIAEENPLSFDIGVDFAYYPKAENVPTGVGTKDVLRFAPTTGAYAGLEGRINLSGEYKIPTPLGSHWLVKDANVTVRETFEITPISIAPSTTVSFTPVPFLVFEGGYKVGTGWNFIGLQGMAVNPDDGATNTYTDLPVFGNVFSKYWVQGTFQFDTGALAEGDWNHVQTMYSYQVYYEGLTGVSDQTVWCWQATGNKVNGVKEYQQAILAYQMPMVWSRVGIIFESDRYLNANAFANPAYNGNFRDMNLSLMSQFSFTDKDTLTVLFNFANRRTYETITDTPDPYLNNTGAEWYFKRFALSYSHKF